MGSSAGWENNTRAASESGATGRTGSLSRAGNLRNGPACALLNSLTRKSAHSPPMPEEKKELEADPKPVTADPVKDAAIFDAFAEQAAKAAVWPDAVKAQLPKKTE
ncbi:hypothetical protein DLREEDagr8_46950 [Dongia sp. agr-C8]